MIKTKHRIASVLVMLFLVVGLGVPAFAEGETGEITAIAAPAAINKPVGTAQADLGLPSELAATALVEGQEQPVTVPVTAWACESYAPDTPDTYTFTATLGTLPYPLATGVNAPGVSVILESPAPLDNVIASFSSLLGEVSFQGFEVGELTGQEGLTLPAQLTATTTGGQSVVIEGVTWACVAATDFPGVALFDTPAFSHDTVGKYTFGATLPQGYSMAEGVSPPTITVYIRPEGGISTRPTSYGGYHAGDVEAMNACIASNKELSAIMSEFKGEEFAPPADWDGIVIWNNTTEPTIPPPYHIEKILLGHKGLTGSLEVSGQLPGGVQALQKLTHLDVNTNQLSSLNLTDLINLDYLSCIENQLTTLDLTGMKNLQRVTCNTNQLTSLKLDSSKMKYIDCVDNQLTEIDLTGMNDLTDLRLDNNQLTTLDLTGKARLDKLYCQNNKLSNLNLDGLTALRHLHLNGNQLTNLDFSDAVNIRVMSCSNNMIKNLDLTGLTNLMDLDCYDNQIEVIGPLPTTLRYLRCYNNQITELDLTGMTGLETLRCDNNQITDLDLSAVVNLIDLFCSNNQITDLDVSALTALQFLDCSENALTTLNVAGLVNLSRLYCGFNQLTALDVSTLTNLVELFCNDNQIKILERFPASLITLRCYNNQLTNLDLAGLVNLTELSCNNNQITDLDASALIALQFLDCSENALTTLDVTGLGSLTKLSCGFNQLTALDVSALTKLFDLLCNDNQIKILERLPASLKNLNCNGNQITNLDISNVKLTYLYCNYNQLTKLDLTGQTDLIHLNCSGNSLPSLDVSKNSKLIGLVCVGNPLTNLDLSGTPNLNILHCANNALSNLDLTGLNNLLQVFCSGNPIREFKSPAGNRMTMVATDAVVFGRPVEYGPIVTENWGYDITKNEITLRAVSGTGKTFENWIFSPAVTLTNGTETSTEITFTLSSDIAVAPVFRYDVLDPPASYTDDGVDRTVRVAGKLEYYLKTTVGGEDAPVSTRSGSTVVTFPAQYLNTLATGDHAVRVHFTDGYADTTLTVGVGAPTVGAITAPAAVNVGKTLSLTAPTVVDNGLAITAQGWQISADGSTGWQAFDPATTITAAHHGQYLRYYATNARGTGVSPNTVQITVKATPAPTQAATPTSPQTGDSGGMGLWATLLAVSVLVLGGLMVTRRRWKC